MISTVSKGGPSLTSVGAGVGLETVLALARPDIQAQYIQASADESAFVFLEIESRGSCQPCV